ncbi:hypothetical protein O1R50_19050 [Glycomyces luteolus]|uniref:Uncharacterized protein n=1 Tax=Glycomyces luteolus TaxID=2670330 RepID=A0A9X3PBL1_9ACTN|nr:hypothetical protein [Glycomyces luteolus]MDA1361734.1 hypothetical protein [Glycomyces luteolus]
MADRTWQDTPLGRRVKAAVALSVAFAAGSLALAPSTAQADTTGDHCAYDIVSEELTCADSPEAALAANSDGLQADSVLVRLYNDTNYGTANGTHTLTAPGSYTCSAGYSPVEFTITRMGSFVNKASSAHTYRSCDVKLFDSADATGTSSTWIDNLANLNTAAGGWANRASSYQVRSPPPPPPRPRPPGRPGPLPFGGKAKGGAAKAAPPFRLGYELNRPGRSRCS